MPPRSGFGAQLLLIKQGAGGSIENLVMLCHSRAPDPGWATHTPENIPEQSRRGYIYSSLRIWIVTGLPVTMILQMREISQTDASIGPQEATLGLPEDLFVGRATELSTLSTRIERALGGTGAACFIFGEAGVGKTRLITEALHNAHVDGKTVISARCRREA